MALARPEQGARPSPPQIPRSAIVERPLACSARYGKFDLLRFCLAKV